MIANHEDTLKIAELQAENARLSEELSTQTAAATASAKIAMQAEEVIETYRDALKGIRRLRVDSRPTILCLDVAINIATEALASRK